MVVRRSASTSAIVAHRFPNQSGDMVTLAA